MKRNADISFESTQMVLKKVFEDLRQRLPKSPKLLRSVFTGMLRRDIFVLDSRESISSSRMNRLCSA